MVAYDLGRRNGRSSVLYKSQQKALAILFNTITGFWHPLRVGQILHFAVTAEPLSDSDKARLKGNADRALFNNAGAVSVSARLSDAGYGSRTTVYGPTTTQRRSLEIASEEFTEIDQQLQELYSGTLKALLQKLDAAGVPWTPGRGALPAE